MIDWLFATMKTLPSGRAKALSGCELRGETSEFGTYRGKRLEGTERARKAEGRVAPPSFLGKNSKEFSGSVL